MLPSENKKNEEYFDFFSSEFNFSYNDVIE